MNGENGYRIGRFDIGITGGDFTRYGSDRSNTLTQMQPEVIAEHGSVRHTASKDPLVVYFVLCRQSVNNRLNESDIVDVRICCGATVVPLLVETVRINGDEI